MNTSKPFSRLMAMILSVALLLAGTPVTPLAAEGDTALGESGAVLGASGPVIAPFALPANTPGESATNPADTEQELQDAIDLAVSGDTVYVGDDITLTGELVIPNGKNLTIDGGNHTITQAASSRHFAIYHASATIKLKDLTLDGSNNTGGGIYNIGSMTLNNVTIQNCSSGSGGGIMNAGGGNLTLESVTIDGCTSTSGGGGGITNNGTLYMTGGAISNCKASNEIGGGIYNTGNLTMTGGTITNCAATEGGGIFNNGNLTMTGGTITNCAATYSGGGIFNNSQSDLTLTRVTVEGCKADTGGGICNIGDLTMTGGTIVNCEAVYSGGGIYDIGTLTLENVTIESCSSGNLGGGIYNYNTLEITGVVTIKDCSSSDYECGGGIDNEGTVTVKSGGVLTLTGNTNLGAGVGIYCAGSDATFDNAGTIECGDRIVVQSGTFTNSGRIEFTGSGGIGVIYGGTITNNSGGVIDIGSGGIISLIDRGTIINDGTINNGGEIIFEDGSGAIINNGTITGDGAITGNGTITGDGAITSFVSIPDPGLRNVLAASGISPVQGTLYDPDHLQRLTFLEAAMMGISDATGIEHMTGLTTLNIFSNELTTLDVSALTKLEHLNCSGNLLTELDVSGLSELSGLDCFHNQLTGLDVSGLTKLEGLFCDGNQLTWLDVSGLQSLRILYCSGNQLTALDVSGLAALSDLNCGNNPITSLDVSSNTALVGLDASNTDITTLNVTGLAKLKVLYLLNTLIPSEADIIGLNKSLTTDFYYSYRGGGSAESHTITATAGPGGSISPSGSVSVAHGGMQGFDFTPDSGYRILQVFVDGVDIPAFAQSGMMAFNDVTEDHKIHVTFAPIGAAVHTITATAGAGGSISPSGSVLVPEGGSQSFTVTPDSGYKISGVTVDGVSHGAIGSYTFTNVTGGHAIHAEFAADSGRPVSPVSPGGTTTGGGSGGSSSGGSSGSGGGSTTTTSTGTTWLEQNSAGSLAGGAKGQNQNSIRTRSSGAYGIRSAALAALAGLKYEHDTVADGAVQVRLTIGSPEKITKDIMVSGYVKGEEVDRIRGYFEKWFKNKVRVIHMDQQEAWGQPVQIAARLDLTGMETNSLCFYSYDKKTNAYKRIEKPAYRTDKNGYLHFTTELAGDIIICEGPLERK